MDTRFSLGCLIIMLGVISGCLSVDPSKYVHSAQDLAGTSGGNACMENEASVNTFITESRGKKITDHPKLVNLPIVKNLETTFGQAVEESGGVYPTLNAETTKKASQLAPKNISHREVIKLAEQLLQVAQDNPPSEPLQKTDMDNLENKPLEEGLTSKAMSAATTTPRSVPPDAASIFILYYMDWVNGTFVDRMGNTVAKPDISKKVTDEAMAGVIAIFLEAAADMYFRTPVFYYEEASGAAGAASKTYINSGKKRPSAAKFKVVKEQKIEEPNSSACGITRAEAVAINFVAEKAGNEAGIASGLLGGTWGGIPIVFIAGVKVSIGDNQTLSTLFKTFCETLSRRGTEYGVYQLLLNTTPKPDSALGKLLGLVALYQSFQ